MSGVGRSAIWDRDDGVARELISFVLTNAIVRSYPGSRQTWNAPYRLSRRTLTHYDIIHLQRGTMTWTVDGTETRLRPRDLLILPPSTPHSACSISTPMSFLSLHVEVALPEGQDVLALLNVPHLQRVDPNSRLADYLAGATAEWDRPSGDPMTALQLSAWARLVALELLDENAEAGTLSPGPVDPLVRAGLEVIHHNIGRRVSPATLAAEVGVSQQHLNRVLRRTLGVTALQALTQLRMAEAASLLSQSPQTVRAIAHRLGYDDPYHFSRVFTRHHGVSPAHWRQVHTCDLDARLGEITSNPGRRRQRADEPTGP